MGVGAGVSNGPASHCHHMQEGGIRAPSIHTHTHTRHTQQTGTSQDAGSSQEGLFAQILVRHSQHKSMAIVWLR